jgi:K+ transporter
MRKPRATHSTALALLALGVVYGDIGTSPLYAVKETFNPQHGIALTPTTSWAACPASSGR